MLWKKDVDVKKLVIGCAAIVGLVVILNLFSGYSKKDPLPEQYDENVIIEESKQVIEYFNERDYQSIIDVSAKKMTESVTAESLAEKCDELIEECGPFVAYDVIETAGSVDKDTKEEFGGAIIVAEYENRTAQFNIWFNEQMELIQFVVR